MTRGTLGRFALLGTLYFAQGMPYGFFVQALPVLLREAGYSLSKIGLAALLALPWALKFLWAPVVDRSYVARVGRRRTWILAMQASAVIVLAAIAVAPGSEGLTVLMAAMLVLNLIAATQDVATDSLAVELLPHGERGIANGLQVAGYRVGMFVGGGVLLHMYEGGGHHETFAAMAVITVLASLPVLASREPATAQTAAIAADVRGAGVRLPHFLSRPGAWRLVALVASYKFGEHAGQSMLRPFLVDRGLGLSDIAWVVGTIGFISGMAGALVGGALVGRLGRRRALIVFGLGQVIAVSGYAYLAFGAPSYRALYVWAGVEHFASGTATASLFTAMMDWSRPETGGTDYTVMASAVVIATTTSTALSGFSADALGYGAHFVVAASLCVCAVLVVAWLFPRRAGQPI